MFRSNQVLDHALGYSSHYSSRVKPPAHEGMDPTLINLYQLWWGNVNLDLPTEVTTLEETHPDLGTYQVAEVKGVRVYFHNNTQQQSGPLFVRIMMRTWEPEGAESVDSDRNTYRNYELYIDVLKSAGETDIDLLILNREEWMATRIDPNVIDLEGGTFSQMSVDKKRKQTILLDRRTNT